MHFLKYLSAARLIKKDVGGGTCIAILSPCIEYSTQVENTAIQSYKHVIGHAEAGVMHKRCTTNTPASHTHHSTYWGNMYDLQTIYLRTSGDKYQWVNRYLNQQPTMQ
jgi:hypothetical protein